MVMWKNCGGCPFSSLKRKPRSVVKLRSRHGKRSLMEKVWWMCHCKNMVVTWGAVPAWWCLIMTAYGSGKLVVVLNKAMVSCITSSIKW